MGERIVREFGMDTYTLLYFKWVTNKEWVNLTQMTIIYLLLWARSRYRIRNGVAIIVNKRVWNAELGCSLKKDRRISVHFQGKPFNITVIQVYAPTSNAEEAEVEQFYEDLQEPSRTNTLKRCSFYYRGMECKAGSQEIPGVAGTFGLGVQNETGQRLTEFCQEKVLVIPNTLLQQHKTLHMDITRWSIPKSDWLYSLQPEMEKLYTVSKDKTGNWLWHRPWTPYCQI